MSAEWFSTLVDDAAVAATRRSPRGARPVQPARPRMVGITRVSEVGEREGDSFISPLDQRKRLEGWAGEFNAVVVKLLEELDVPGKLPLDKRPGLREAVELIEAGRADVLVFAYFDRSFRNTIVQMETIARINAAGGTVFAVGYGEMRIDTASQWFSTLVQAAANELVSRQTGEKVINAKREAVLRGVPPFPRIPRGYRRGEDGRLVVVPSEAVAIAEAFSMRAARVPLTQIRRWLSSQGIELTYSSTKELFKSRILLGELHAGTFSNLHAHPAIVDRAVWQRVQRTRLPRGPQASSEGGLLSRMGLLLCSGCKRSMSRSAVKRRNGDSAVRYAIYRCSMMGECPQAVTIGAELVERLVIERLEQELEATGKVGTATPGDQVRAAEDELARRQRLLEAAVEAFEGLDIVATRQRLQTLQHDVEEADDRLATLRAAIGPAVVITAIEGLQRASVDQVRRLLRATFQSITVLPAPRQGRHGDQVARARLDFKPLDPLVK